jgi:hypothetical protein
MPKLKYMEEYEAYVLWLCEPGIGYILSDDDVIQLYYEAGNEAPKIQQRRADEKRKARNNEHH